MNLKDLGCRLSVWKPGETDGFDIEGALPWGFKVEIRKRTGYSRRLTWSASEDQ
jgi:hypothetical protein